MSGKFHRNIPKWDILMLRSTTTVVVKTNFWNRRIERGYYKLIPPFLSPINTSRKAYNFVQL